MAPTVDTAGTGHASGNGRARPLSDAERQERSAHLVGVLARALTAQFDELARTGQPAPEGWWFSTGGTGGRNGTLDGAASTDGSGPIHGAHAVERATDGVEDER